MAGETFGEDVSVLKSGGNMQNPNVSKGNFFSNEMDVHFNVFGPLMLHGVSGEVNGGDIVAID